MWTPSVHNSKWGGSKNIGKVIYGLPVQKLQGSTKNEEKGRKAIGPWDCSRDLPRTVLSTPLHRVCKYRRDRLLALPDENGTIKGAGPIGGLLINTL